MLSLIQLLGVHCHLFHHENLKQITSFQILFILVFSVSLKGLLDSMLHVIGFDGVLGGVVFGVLSPLVNFTLDAIVGMTTFGSNSYLVFSR